MPVRRRLMPAPGPAAGVTVAGRAAAMVLLAALLASPPALPDRGADGLLPRPPPAVALFAAAAGAPALIVRVYPNAARDDEFVEVANPTPEALDLGGWSLSDLEDRASFPNGTRLPPGGRLVATRNATSYAEDERKAAALTYDRGNGPRMEGGVLRLADAGDEVLLLDPLSGVVDAYVYGTSAYAGAGWTGPAARPPARGEIATRTGSGSGWEDHDDASDWDGVRAYRLGQSAFAPPAVAIATVPQVLVSPDDGRGRLLSFLASADRTLEVAVYTLTSAAIASVIADRARDGVRVRVLLEGSPVGGVEDRERQLIGSLLASGADVRCLSGGLDAVKRYRYLHAKYAIVDAAAVLVSSENFGDSGFPAPGTDGNRGWSVIVEDFDLARQLWEVFAEDSDPSGADSVPATALPPPVLDGPAAILPWLPSETRGRRDAQLVVGPDNALTEDGLLGLLDAATDRIEIEAFYADDPWGDRPNPLLDAAFAAARRGVSVRILLDGSGWSAEEETTANDVLAAALNDRAAREAVDLEVRIFAPQGNVERVHNKGAVVDGRVALVSSLNWAHGSATENRELGLLLRDPEVAARLEAAFLADWEGRVSASGPGDVTITDPATLAALYAFIAAASALSLRKLRRRDKGLKRRPRFVPRGLLRPHLGRGRREVRLLSSELVAEPGDGAGGGTRDRGGGEEAPRGRGGPEGDRGP